MGIEVEHDEAMNKECPWNNFSPCKGDVCMAWNWMGRAFEECETDNLVETDDGKRPIGDVQTPPGEDWQAYGQPFNKSYHQSQKLKLPPATAQRWRRKVARQTGFCSRAMFDRYGGF